MLPTVVAIACFVFFIGWLYVALRRRNLPPVCITGNKRLETHLYEHSTVLKEAFSPSWWCFGARPQTLLRALLKTKPHIPYEREVLELPDGGCVGLDWFGRPSAHKPLVVLLPGLTGDSTESYIKHMALCISDEGYPTVIFNNRGNGGVDLKTPRLYSAFEIDDFSQVIKHLRKNYSNSPIVACGISLGGLIVFNYVSANPHNSQLHAAITVSMPWSCEKSAINLEVAPNFYFFNSQLTKLLQRRLAQNKESLCDHYDMDKILKATSVREIDTLLICPMFGWSTPSEYYDAASPDRKLADIGIPLVTIVARDDPFVPECTLPLEKIASLKRGPVMLITEHGGHIGWLDGMGCVFRGVSPSFHRTYIDRLLGDLIRALVTFEDKPELTNNNGNACTDLGAKQNGVNSVTNGSAKSNGIHERTSL